jgi:phospholipid/cholesterol/gamma-HCH transport system ATP-binding protein
MNKIIEVQNLSASFGKKRVLHDVSFSAWQNEITVILGSSGCGKTTVMKHLIGLYPVKRGNIKILGENRIPLSEEYENELQLKMGVLFQNGALINSLTIAENIAIPLQQHTDLPDSIINDLIRVKLKLVELDHTQNLFPSELSGGMRKRAALARAIALDPPLLFCDEPSAGLDPVTLSSLDQLILNLRDQLGMTILLVTHEVSSIFR